MARLNQTQLKNQKLNKQLHDQALKQEKINSNRLKKQIKLLNKLMESGTEKSLLNKVTPIEVESNYPAKSNIEVVVNEENSDELVLGHMAAKTLNQIHKGKTPVLNLLKLMIISTAIANQTSEATTSLRSNSNVMNI